MEIIKKIFTEAPNLMEAYYIIIAIALLGGFIFTFLPEKIALKLFIPYQLVSHRAFLHQKEKKSLNWSKALKRQRLLLLFLAFLATLILVLSSFYGQILAKIGLAILAASVIIGGYWVNPTK